MKKILLFILILSIPRLSVFAQQQSLSNYLLPDGKLKPNTEMSESFDARHYRIWLSEDGEPHFSPPGSQNQPQSSKDVWEDPFSTKGHGYDSLIDKGYVSSIASDGENLYLGGSFEYFNDIRCYNVIKYNSTTHLWSKLDSGFNGTINVLQVHNGKLYAGGRFTTKGFNSRSPIPGVAEWDGAHWQPLGNGTDGNINCMAFHDSSVIIGGYFSNAGGYQVSNIARWDGHTWDDMNYGLNYAVDCLLQNGDSLFVGGEFAGSPQNFNRVALYYQGNWQALGEGVSGSVYALAIYNGLLWVGGDFTGTVSLSQELRSLATWDGNNWNSFGSVDSIGCEGGVVETLNVINDTLYIGGSFSQLAGTIAHGIARYKNGKFFSAGRGNAGPGTYGNVNVIATFNNHLYVGGTFTQAGDITLNNIAILDQANQFEKIDTGSGATGGYSETYINAVALAGKYVIIGGSFSTIGGLAFNHIALWDRTSKQWFRLGHGLDRDVFVLAVYGTKIFVGGDFNYLADEPGRHIGYWDLNDGQWHVMGSGAMRSVSAIAANKTGVYASVFSPIEGNTINNYIGKWDGTNWNQMDGAILGYVNAMAIKDSTLYIGGTIARIDGAVYHNIAYHDQTGWNPLGGGVDNEVRSLVLVGNDLYAAGYFSTADGVNAPGIARWDGQNWNDLSGGLNNPGYTMTWNGSALYVGGAFTTAGGVTANHLAKWDGLNWKSVVGGTEYNIYGIAGDSAALFIGGGFSLVNTNMNSYRFAILHFGTSGVKSGDQISQTGIKNFPNPFTNSTTITYDVSKGSPVKLEICNDLGNWVKTLVNEYKSEGTYEVVFDASELPSGTYFCRYIAGSTAPHIGYMNIIK